MINANQNSFVANLNNQTPKTIINSNGRSIGLRKIWARDINMNIMLNPSLSIRISNQDKQKLLDVSLVCFMKDQPNTSMVDIMKKIEDEKEITIELYNSLNAEKEFDMQLEYELI